MARAGTLPVMVICGPTASGKSAAGLAAAEEFGGTVINADSMQVYADLRVLTARPTAEEESRVPHRLFGVAPATERWSAGRWLAAAAAAIGEARDAGRLPVVVGGTGLYLKALMEGLAPVPEIASHVREAARARLAELGGEAFRAELAGLDPEAASRIAASDPQRLIRAWEVATATGRPLSAWHREAAPVAAVAGPFAAVALMPPRDILYARIDKRFRAMLEAGALAEVAALEARGLPEDLPAMKALGLAELRAHLRGEMTLAEAAEAATRATRNFAKRQYTWFRHQLRPGLLLEEQYSESLNAEIFSFIRVFC